MEIEREKQAAQQSETQRELEEMRAKIQQMEMENSGRAPGALKRGMSAQGFNLFKPKEEMLVIAAKKMERAAKKGRTDPTALGRVLQTSPSSRRATTCARSPSSSRRTARSSTRWAASTRWSTTCRRWGRRRRTPPTSRGRCRA